MASVVTASGSIDYTVRGSGPPVLLLAGWGSTSNAWRALMQPLAARYTVIAVDSRRALCATKSARIVGINAMADDAIAVLDGVGAGAAHVVGNSLGGLVAQSVAHRHARRVLSLILLSTSLGTPSIPSSPLLLLDGIRAFRRRNLRQGGGSTTSRQWSRHGSGAQLLATLGWCGLRALPQVRARTLVIHGSRDRVIPLINARIVAGLVPGAQLLVVGGAGHLILSDAAEQVADAITEFLSGASLRPQDLHGVRYPPRGILNPATWSRSSAI